MNQQEFERLAQLAKSDLCSALQRFSQSSHNRQVYAISLAIHQPGDTPTLAINWEADAPPTVAGRRLDVEQDRYHSGLFTYQDRHAFSPEALLLFERFRSATRDLSRLQDDESQGSPARQHRIGLEWDRLHAGYYGALFEALNGLMDALARIDTVPNCIRYVYLIDNNEQARVQHFKHTIAQPLFDAVFAAYRARDRSTGGDTQ